MRAPSYLFFLASSLGSSCPACVTLLWPTLPSHLHDRQLCQAPLPPVTLLTALKALSCSQGFQEWWPHRLQPMPHASWTSHLHVPPPCLRPATSKMLVPSLFPYNYLWENHWSFQFSSLSSWPSRFGLTLHDSYSSSISSLFPTPQGPSSRKTDHGWGHAHHWTSTPQVPFIRWRLSLQSLFQ